MAPTVVDLAQELVRLDTTNPPGNEHIAADVLERVLHDAGIGSKRFESTPGRTNLVARVNGTGHAPPMLLQGHVDVVTTTGQAWQHPPFAAEIADGFLWGRGALDMKGGVAMIVGAALRAAKSGRLPGDLVLAFVADEEAGGVHGASWLVDNHPGLFEGIKHGIGEGGGQAQHLGGRTFYTVMVSEKRGCQMVVRLRGPGGHGSIPLRGGAMARLAEVIGKLDSSRLPVHITPPVRMELEGMRDALDEPLKSQIGSLLEPSRVDETLAQLGALEGHFDAVLHNTVNPTMVSGGIKINVIPSLIELQLDGRLLPGYHPEDMLREVRDVIGPEPELEVVQTGPAQSDVDLGQFELFAAVLREADPGCVPIPYLVTGGTDARHFARLGIRTYGFLPLNLPPGFNGAGLLHAADERVPVSALEFGAECVYEAVMRYRG